MSIKEEITKSREKLREIYNKYINEFFEINKKIDEYLETLEG
jgi:hypothetical protein